MRGNIKRVSFFKSSVFEKVVGCVQVLTKQGFKDKTRKKMCFKGEKLSR